MSSVTRRVLSPRPRADNAGLSPGGGSGNPAEFSLRPRCRCTPLSLGCSEAPGRLVQAGKQQPRVESRLRVSQAPARTLCRGHGVQEVKVSQVSPGSVPTREQELV